MPVSQEVKDAIENAAQVLYAVAKTYSDNDDDETSNSYCAAAEYVRRSIDPDFY